MIKELIKVIREVVTRGVTVINNDFTRLEVMTHGDLSELLVAPKTAYDQQSRQD
jgi:hypothetical protein